MELLIRVNLVVRRSSDRLFLFEFWFYNEDMEKSIFYRKRPVFSKFEEYGFVKTGAFYILEKDFLDNSFRAIIKIDEDGDIRCKVIDKMNDEEYLPLNLPSYNGQFVNLVRTSFNELLSDIASFCYTDVLFSSDQANRIASFISDKYNIVPDFPWDETPHQSSGVFRHIDNRKWFALVMNIKRGSVDKSDSSEMVDVMNLKAEKIELKDGIYGAYHMNKRYWISIILDDFLSDEKVFALVESSYILTK